MLANQSFIVSQKLVINKIINKVKFFFFFCIGKNEMSLKKMELEEGSSKQIHESVQRVKDASRPD